MIQSSSIVPIDLTELAKKAMKERNFLTEFSPDVQAEVTQIPDSILTILPSIKDLRKKLWFSIDNDDTKDLDQLTYREQLEAERIKIYIAIANVEDWVAKDSAIDQHAQQNTTSIYTPTKVFSMLPTKLSTNLTSLNEKQDRLAIVVEATMTANGSIEDHILYSAYVCNQAKLTYNRVASWLDGEGPIPDKILKVEGLEEQVKLQDKVAHRLKNFRYKQGALTFDVRESYPVIEHNKIVGVKTLEKNRAHDLIENLMIVANTATAHFLSNHQRPSLQRVVRIPKRWDRIVAIAKEYGDSLPEQPDSKALEIFLIKRWLLEPLHFSDLSLVIIKLLGRGEYIIQYPGEEPIGHFSLAIKHYTHSTAPNRRYTDLITQRLITSIFKNKPSPYSDQELEALARHCTQKENDAEKVERKMKKSAIIVILSSKINEIFDGLVTGATPKGTWIRIFHPPVEGKLIQGFENVDVGEQIKVKLVHVDIEAGFIDFIRVGNTSEQSA
jgi:exoribonuclease-2